MIKIKPLGLASLAALLCALTLSACEFSVSTAGIGAVITSKEKGGAAATTFANTDKVHARAEIKHASNGTKMIWRTYVTEAEGLPPNSELKGAEVAVDLVSGADAVNYSIGGDGVNIPTGTYKLEATLYLEGGKQQEQKSVEIKVKGS